MTNHQEKKNDIDNFEKDHDYINEREYITNQKTKKSNSHTYTNFEDMNDYYNYNYKDQMYYDNSFPYESPSTFDNFNSYNMQNQYQYDRNEYSQYNVGMYTNYPKILKEAKRKAKQRVCSNCATTSTPSWRRGEKGKSLLCNACGLYQKLHGRARPYTVTSTGRTKALKGGYEKTICVSCSTPYLVTEVKGGSNSFVCDNCMTHLKVKNQNRNQYYKYGNYYNYYADADVSIEAPVDINNTIYENIRKDNEKDF